MHSCAFYNCLCLGVRIYSSAKVSGCTHHIGLCRTVCMRSCDPDSRYFVYSGASVNPSVCIHVCLRTIVHRRQSARKLSCAPMSQSLYLFLRACG